MSLRRRPIVALGGLSLATAGCAPQAGNEQGDAVKGLYDVFSVTAAVIFVIVAGLIAWSIIRYRAKPGDNELPDQFHSNVKLEVLWFAIPTVIVIGLFIISAVVLNDINEEAQEPAAVVNVQAFQWGWRFDFEDAGVTITSRPGDAAAISLPVGEPITFVISSNDVVHSFYIHEFLLKRDAIPGKENRLAITINEEGTYGGQCAEFCGLLHSEMPFTIDAVSLDEYRAWLEEQQSE
ncbi:MAG: cytochrome c oxidase subunit II [Actinomycetota bacterium]